MTKQTPEQRANKRAAKKAADEAAALAYKQQQAEELARFKAGLPKRMMDAQALAAQCGVASHITLIASGPSITFEYENHSKKKYIDYTITYESEEWEIDSLESDLRALKIEQDAAARRLQLAKDTFAKLSSEECAAIKEFISYLKV